MYWHLDDAAAAGLIIKKTHQKKLAPRKIQKGMA